MPAWRLSCRDPGFMQMNDALNPRDKHLYFPLMERFALPKLKLSHNASCGAYRVAAWFFAGFEMNST